MLNLPPRLSDEEIDELVDESLDYIPFTWAGPMYKIVEDFELSEEEVMEGREFYSSKSVFYWNADEDIVPEV